MSDSQKLHIAFVWHMHQPYYKNLKDKYFQMPWVRLHGIKDYFDMVAILDEFPGIKQTFNLVPSLIEQIDEYTEGNGSDRHLELSKKAAAELSIQDKNEILNSFFSAHHPTMIQPYPRYRKLLSKSSDGVDAFITQDFLDLQVWSNLAWFDPIFRKEPFIANLISKGEGFAEGEKLQLLDRQNEILKSIIPKYREVQDRGQIEVSITPFYHPILPLLFNSDIARKSNPGTELPENKFHCPEDAEYQVSTAVEFYKNRFGRKPRGMWPSEGSVSQDIIPIIARYGIEWIASDEEILACSLGRSPDRNDSDNVSSTGELYQPYTVKNDKAVLSMIFRDHVLSDRLGFVYANWNPEAAAQDFIDNLLKIKIHLEKINAPGRLVPVILDGENAWEYYINDGHDFFHQLYTKISDHPELKTVTVSGYLDKNKKRGEIKKLFPGSWINHNFNVWIGHKEDNLAWDLLSKTREMLKNFQISNNDMNFSPEKLKIAWKEIYIAEGSDWCWWFGDEHVGPNNDRFDSLFRSNLLYIYELVGKDAPAELLKPIRSNFLGSNITLPTDYIRPVIDGKRSGFYEWYSAGYFDCIKAGSTMHRAVHHTKGIYFGFDRENLFLRIDPDSTLDHKVFLETDFCIEFYKPNKLNIVFNALKGLLEVENGGDTDPNLLAKLDKFLELQIPMKIFSTRGDFKFDFRVIVSHNGNQLEVWPPVDVISIILPRSAPELIFW